MSNPLKTDNLSGAEWAAIRKRAIASKDPVCAICHRQIDLEAKRFTPLSLEVDHIVPRALGGSLYNLDNLQLTHSKCNRKKGARLPADPDSVQPENPVPLSNPW